MSLLRVNGLQAAPVRISSQRSEGASSFLLGSYGLPLTVSTTPWTQQHIWAISQPPHIPDEATVDSTLESGSAFGLQTKKCTIRSKSSTGHRRPSAGRCVCLHPEPYVAASA